MCLTQCLAGSRWSDEGRPFDRTESLRLVEAIVVKISAYRRHVYTDVMYIVLYFPTFQSVGVARWCHLLGRDPSRGDPSHGL